MNSPTSNLGRGFDALLRDIERWKERTSDASVGPGTIHGRYFYYGDYDKGKSSGDQSSHADIEYQRYHHHSLQDLPGEIAGMRLF